MFKRTQLLFSFILVACLSAWGSYAFAAQTVLPKAQQVQQAPRAAALGSRVNINTANAETLARVLNGIGLKKAQAIVVFRQQHGPFKSLAELNQVKGIGDATVKKNAGLILLK